MSLVYVFGLRISRLILAEINYGLVLYIRPNQYLQTRCCQNFQEFGDDYDNLLF